MVQTVQETVEIYGPDHRDFTVAVHLKGGRCPAGAVHRVPHFVAVAVVKGFFARFTGFFRTPSTWTSSARLAATFFEPSMANSCWSSRAPVL